MKWRTLKSTLYWMRRPGVCLLKKTVFILQFPILLNQKKKIKHWSFFVKHSVSSFYNITLLWLRDYWAKNRITYIPFYIVKVSVKIRDLRAHFAVAGQTHSRLAWWVIWYPALIQVSARFCSAMINVTKSHIQHRKATQ